MQKILSIAIADLRVTFSDRSIWITAVVIPAVLIVLIGGFANGGFFVEQATERPQQRVDVLDLDNTALSTQLVEALPQIGNTLFVCPPLEPTEDDPCLLDGNDLTPELGEERLAAGNTLAYIEIPAGFEAAVLTGEPVEVVFKSDDDPTQTTSNPALTALQAAVQHVSGAGVAAQLGESIAAETLDTDASAFAETVYERAASIWQDAPIDVTYTEYVPPEDVIGENEPAGFRVAVPGMGSMYVMFTVLAGAVILIQERKNWTLQRLATMPVTKAELIAGKMLSRFVMGILQFVVAFTVGLVLAVIFDINFGNSIIGLILVIVAFVFFVSSLTLLLATLVSTEEQASAIVTLLALTLAPIGGAWWPLDLEFIPEIMRQIAVISPIYWAMEGFNAIIRFGGGIADVLVPVGILVAAGLIVFGLAVARFRVA